MVKPGVDLSLGIFIIALAALAVLVLIPAGIVLPDGIEIAALSPDFWPMIIIVVLGISGVIVVIQALTTMRSRATGNDGTPQEEELAEELHSAPVQAARLGLVVLWLLAVYLLIPEIGMVSAMVVTLAFLAWFAGERRWRLIVPIAIVLPIVLHLFFVYVANVPLPVGLFEAWR